MENQRPTEIHTQRPDGTFVATHGPFAGLRAKMMGGQTAKNGQIRIVHHEPTLPYYFDPAYSKAQPIEPSLIQAQIVAAVEAEKKPEQTITTEAFTKNAPTEANPWADLQIEIDEDEIVTSEVISEEPLSNAEINNSGELSTDELLDILINRDLRDFGMTNEEFNSLRLSKKQLWRLHEQIIGRSANKPTVSQAIKAVIDKANTSGSNYARVMQAIKRVRENVQ